MKFLRYTVLQTALLGVASFSAATAQETTVKELQNNLAVPQSQSLGHVDQSNPDNGLETQKKTTASSGPSSLQLITSADDPLLPTVEMATIAVGDASFTIDLKAYFGFDSAILRPESKIKIDSLCQAVIADNTNKLYQVIGHTTASSQSSDVQNLAQARADEVVRYMVEQCRIKPQRLEAIGMSDVRRAESNAEK